MTQSKGRNCTLWVGDIDSDGYGVAPAGVAGKRVRAHRVEWERHFGPIPEGLVVMHLCDRPACIEIHHLVLGTQLANVYDRQRKQRQPSRGLNGRAQLSERQVETIRELKGRWTQAELAKRFCVSSGAIAAIQDGRNWRTA